MQKKLAIIGAGIAGLTLANLIKKFSEHQFMLYEKEESLSLEEGYGIQLSPNSIKILNQIDFKKKVNNRSIYNPEGVDFYNIKNGVYLLEVQTNKAIIYKKLILNK